MVAVTYGDMIGAPFAWHGRSPKTGVDCYWVVLEYYRRLGLELEDPISEYSEGFVERGEDPIVPRIEAPWRETARPYQPGDVAILRMPGGDRPQHLGVLVGTGGMLMLHASDKLGVVTIRSYQVEHLFFAVIRHEALRC